jgi:hypothetical protein
MKLLYLFLILLSILHSEEMGVPYVDPRKAVAQSVTLSPDGETFYTYANNTLTHWSLNPVKVLESVKIEDPDFSNQRLINIYVTPDQKRIIFVCHEKAFGIFDLSTKKFTKKINEEFYRENFIGTHLITIDTDKTMKLWNSVDLHEEKRTKIDNLLLNCDHCSDLPLALLKSEDEKTICIVTGIRMIAIEPTTLKIIKDVISYNKDFYVSLNHSIVVGMEQSFNFQTLELVPSLSYEWLKEHPDKFFDHYNFRTPSFNNSLFLRKSSFYKKLTNQKLATLYQYKNDSWIVMTPDGYFDWSEGSLRYLKKKLSSGTTFATPDGTIRTPQTLDIADDAMIQKYHKPIYLNDLTKDK